MSTIRELLSQKSVAELQVAFSLIEQEDPTLDTPEDYDRTRAADLMLKVRSGMFDVPISNLPIDFHKFYSIVAGYCNDAKWWKETAAKYDITQEWVFNAIASNYPMMSMDKMTYDLFVYFFEFDHATGNFPPSHEFKYFMRFVHDYRPSIEDVFNSEKPRLSKLWTAYEGYKAGHVEQCGNRLPNCPYLQQMDKPEVFKDFFTAKLVCDDIELNGVDNRKFMILIPSEILNIPDREFEIYGFKFML